MNKGTKRLFFIVLFLICYDISWLGFLDDGELQLCSSRSEGKAHENGGTTKDSPKRQDEIVHQHQQNYGPDLVHHSAKHHLAVELESRNRWRIPTCSYSGKSSDPMPFISVHLATTNLWHSTSHWQIGPWDAAELLLTSRLRKEMPPKAPWDERALERVCASTCQTTTPEWLRLMVGDGD